MNISDISFWQVIWFFLLALTLAGYSILDGFDLGVGMLLPLTSNQKIRRGLLSAISPFWDGNEVWLIAVGAALFSSFPIVFGTILSGYYAGIMIVVFSLILRAVALEFWFHDASRRTLWTAVIGITSLLIPLLLGTLLGNLIQGVILTWRGEVFGGTLSLFKVYPLICGLLVTTTFLIHGTGYTALKADKETAAFAQKAGRWLWIPAAILFVAFVIMTLKLMPVEGKRLVWVIMAGFSAICLAVAGWSAFKEKPRDLFSATTMFIIGLWGTASALHFPNLVRASSKPAYSLTIYNTSSSIHNLRLMGIFFVIGMALVIIFTVILFRVFKGSVAGYSDNPPSAEV